MPKKTTVVAMFFFIVNALLFSAIGQKLQKKTEKIIMQLIPGQTIVSHQLISISPEMIVHISEKTKARITSDQIDFWSIKNGTTRKYALADEAYGKTHPFSFLVIFDDRATIQAVRIIKYNEEYGWEIKNKKWLKQFSNKNLASSLPGENKFDSISGATISSQSLIKGIEKLSYLMLYLLHSDKNLKDQFNQK